jgi:hypothetical protein
MKKFPDKPRWISLWIFFPDKPRWISPMFFFRFFKFYFFLKKWLRKSDTFSLWIFFPDKPRWISLWFIYKMGQKRAFFALKNQVYVCSDANEAFLQKLCKNRVFSHFYIWNYLEKKCKKHCFSRCQFIEVYRELLKKISSTFFEKISISWANFCSDANEVFFLHKIGEKLAQKVCSEPNEEPLPNK